MGEEDRDAKLTFTPCLNSASALCPIFTSRDMRPLPLLGTLFDSDLCRVGLRTSPPTLVPIPLSVETMLARGLFCTASLELGGGGRGVLRAVLLLLAVRPLLGRVRESPRAEPGGILGMSTLVGMPTCGTTLSGEKVSREGAWKPSIFSKLSFCKMKEDSDN